MNSLHQLLVPAPSLCSGLCPTSHVHMSRVPLSFYFIIFGSHTTCFSWLRQSATPTDFRFLIRSPLDSDAFQGHVVSTWLLLFLRLYSGEPIFSLCKDLCFTFGVREGVQTNELLPCLVSSESRVIETGSHAPASRLVDIALPDFYVALIIQPDRLDGKKSQLICCWKIQSPHHCDVNTLLNGHFISLWRHYVNNNRLVCVVTKFLWVETFMRTRMQTKEGDCCRSGMKLEKKNPINLQ